MLGVMNADVYAIAVSTIARGWGSIDGEYLFHTMLADGWGGGISGVWGKAVRHSAKVRNMAMSVKYRQWA